MLGFLLLSFFFLNNGMTSAPASAAGRAGRRAATLHIPNGVRRSKPSSRVPTAAADVDVMMTRAPQGRRDL